MNFMVFKIVNNFSKNKKLKNKSFYSLELLMKILIFLKYFKVLFLINRYGLLIKMKICNIYSKKNKLKYKLLMITLI